MGDGAIMILFTECEEVGKGAHSAVATIEDTEVMSTAPFWECGRMRGVDVLLLHTNTHYGFSKADLCSCWAQDLRL